MNGRVAAVIYETEDGKEFTLVVEDTDIYEEGDGTTMITIDWKKQALQAVAYIQFLKEQRREAQATPPEYNENN